MTTLFGRDASTLPLVLSDLDIMAWVVVWLCDSSKPWSAKRTKRMKKNTVRVVRLHDEHRSVDVCMCVSLYEWVGLCKMQNRWCIWLCEQSWSNKQASRQGINRAINSRNLENDYKLFVWSEICSARLINSFIRSLINLLSKHVTALFASLVSFPQTACSLEDVFSDETDLQVVPSHSSICHLRAQRISLDLLTA